MGRSRLSRRRDHDIDARAGSVTSVHLDGWTRMECPRCLAPNALDPRRCRACRIPLGPGRPRHERRWRAVQVLPGTVLRPRPSPGTVAGVIASIAVGVMVGVAAWSRSLWVSVAAVAPVVALVGASTALVGWPATKVRVRRATGRAVAWSRGQLPGAFGAIDGSMVAGLAGGRVRHVRYRGIPMRVDPGDLLRLVVLPVGRRRRVVWSQDLASGRRWVASSVLWAVFGVALVASAAGQLVLVGT